MFGLTARYASMIGSTYVLNLKVPLSLGSMSLHLRLIETFTARPWLS